MEDRKYNIRQRLCHKCLLFTVIVFLLGTASGCSFLFLDSAEDFPSVFTKTERVLVVVADNLFDPLTPELDLYTADLAGAGIEVITSRWNSGSAEDLRQYLHTQAAEEKINSVMLVGTLPAAWYEMNSDGRNEKFPSDLFLMDINNVWWDADNNGIYDHHSKVNVSLPVSRVIGTEAELKAYFDKVHRYRAGELQMPISAFIFKDDDWSDFYPGSSFGLSRIYRDYEIFESLGISTKAEYYQKLTTSGAEFINQWIHSYPRALFVQENSLYQSITLNDIYTQNFRGHFYNLFDCSAARFTEENLGMTYLMKTDYALGVFGSTKVGGCYQPLIFYDILARKGTWGDAYKQWYNHYGYKSDSWFLGMVLLGDPALKVHTSGPVYRMIDMSLPPEPEPEDVDVLEDKFRQFFDSTSF